LSFQKPSFTVCPFPYGKNRKKNKANEKNRTALLVVFTTSFPAPLKTREKGAKKGKKRGFLTPFFAQFYA
jgi:hypothetical protein